MPAHQINVCKHALKRREIGEGFTQRWVARCFARQLGRDLPIVGAGCEDGVAHSADGLNVFGSGVDLSIGQQASDDLPRTSYLHAGFLVVDLDPVPSILAINGSPSAHCDPPPRAGTASSGGKLRWLVEKVMSSA